MKIRFRVPQWLFTHDFRRVRCRSVVGNSDTTRHVKNNQRPLFLSSSLSVRPSSQSLHKQVRICQSVELLKDLIAIPSVNPMGAGCQWPGVPRSRGVTEYLGRWFTELGVEFHRIELKPQRKQYCRTLCGQSGSPHCASGCSSGCRSRGRHDDFRHSFRKNEMGGFMVEGRGDVKGGMASMLTAFARVGS